MTLKPILGKTVGVNQVASEDSRPELRRAGRPANIGGKRVQVYLDPESLYKAELIGGANVSAGIRMALKAFKLDPPTNN